MAKAKVIQTEDTPGVEPEITNTAVALIEPITERPAFIDLLVFPQKEASLKIISDRRAEYDKVKITGVDDKANYTLVVAQMSQMRDDRRAFENAAYANVIDPLKDKLKEYAADIDIVVEAFKAAEKAERDKKDFIDNEKKRIKLEKEEAAARAVQKRISDIGLLGGIFEGNSYTFPYDGSLFISSLQVNDFDDEEFAEFLKEVTDAYDAETIRLQEVEDARLRQIELNKEQAIQVAAQAQQNEADNLKLLEKRTSLRLKELKMAGFNITEADDEKYIHPVNPMVFHIDEIKIIEDEQWDELIYDIEHFVPEVEPLVNDLPDEVQTITEDEVVVGFGAPTIHYGDVVASELGLGDHVEPEEKPVFLEEGAIILPVFFSNEHPFIQFDISKKLAMRVFPECFMMEACENQQVANEGELQELKWIIIPQQAYATEPGKIVPERDTFNP